MFPLFKCSLTFFQIDALLWLLAIFSHGSRLEGTAVGVHPTGVSTALRHAKQRIARFLEKRREKDVLSEKKKGDLPSEKPNI
jgi:hypothetical protein